MLTTQPWQSAWTVCQKMKWNFGKPRCCTNLPIDDYTHANKQDENSLKDSARIRTRRIAALIVQSPPDDLRIQPTEGHFSPCLCTQKWSYFRPVKCVATTIKATTSLIQMHILINERSLKYNNNSYTIHKQVLSLIA